MSVNIVFGFILTLIILAVVLVFGSGVINDLFAISGDSQLVTQVVELQKISCGQARNNECSSGLYWRLVGDSEKFKFNLAGGFSKICFFDTESDLYRATETWDAEDAIAIDEMTIKKYNVYGFKPNGNNLGFVIPKLRARENFCITKNTDLILTAKGQYVEVSEQV